jgi:hypothetical protein
MDGVLSTSHVVEIFGIRRRYDDKALARLCGWDVVELLMFDSLPIFDANPHSPRRKSGLEGEARCRTRDLCHPFPITFCYAQGNQKHPIF